MSYRFRQVSFIMSFLARLGEKFQVHTDAFYKGVETYNFSVILEINVGLEGKATRLIVSRA